MGALENKYFDNQPGELTLLPPIDVDLSKTALVIIDMQYLDAHPDHGVILALSKIAPGSTDYYKARLETVVPAIKQLLIDSRNMNLRIIHIVVGSKYRDLRDFNKRMRHWIMDLEQKSGMQDLYWVGAPGFNILEELAPEDGETIIRKTSYGAFNSTNIENQLREMDINSLIVTGCVTNFCVETTVRDAADRGFSVMVVDEAVAGFSAESHKATLHSLRSGFAAVIPTAQDAIALLKDVKSQSTD